MHPPDLSKPHFECEPSSTGHVGDDASRHEHLLLSLAGAQRSERRNRRLAYMLAPIAGAEDIWGWLSLHHYTSHMSGVTSGLARAFALQSPSLEAAGLVSILSFVAGSTATTILVRWGSAQALQSRYALPLLVEAVLLLAVAVTFHGQALLPFLSLLCAAMGMQNAMITKVSDSVIRTTHVTGILTDLGIHLGRLLVRRGAAGQQPSDTVQARAAIRLLGLLFLLFLGGGILSTLSYRPAGSWVLVFLSLLLLLLAVVPIQHDLRRLRALPRRA